MQKVLVGRSLAESIKEKIKNEIESNRLDICLAVILASDDEGSCIYVEHKIKACESVGIKSKLLKIDPAKGFLEKRLLENINYLNLEKKVNGILCQLPMPKIVNRHKIFDKINPLKDVDVFHPENVGLLLQGRARFKPCTPHGIQRLLSEYRCELDGKRVCIINRSDIVGKPLAAMLIQDQGNYTNATVKICHDHTSRETLIKECKNSDVIVVAVGIPNFLTKEMVNENSIVIDVGINRKSNSTKITGDCHPEIYDIVKAYSPVPGGCGPLTVAMLLENTLSAYNLQKI